MSRFWSSKTRELKPYVPGEQPREQRLIKLNTNELPYGPSPRALAAMRDACDDSLRLYPDPTGLALRQSIARTYGLDVSQVFVGNGSDEVLAHAFQALLQQSAPLRFPDITYSFYPVYCGLYGIESVRVPLTQDLRLQPEDYQDNAGPIIFANPNAPTGTALPLSEVEAIVAANPDHVVVIDEAYVDFGGESAVPLIARYDNLLVVHTLSKSRGLAGLRVGYALGHADLIGGLVRVKDSFNSYPLDRLALAGAQAAVEDTAYLAECCARVALTRANTVAALRQLGFDVLPSAANFIFARHPGRHAAELAGALRQRHIIVRHFQQARIEQYLRISIGTDAEMAALCDALSGILADQGGC
ncbi:histidinol phosphate aminotransferase [Kerstersia gyiorum]|uniref:Histidinol-phosphate aminotransferase n=1 Tax=Kerstersia gyiorum TaxID=206506 RepID=A0A4Q7MQY7_9BURK|nr:histidinol-phosphate transaminase [Kerstersia gyiorum]KAB0543776.1 histidinol-phosphate transaminase [Kerstersia gyiorum]RZS70191.1 histidinol phosphate aminotransferase [Kerstersia gyiorum]